MIVEVCVDCVSALEAAVTGGCDRIELCSALALGGLTPSAGLIAEAARIGVPVMAMIRPRAGDFVWSEAEIRQMETDIAFVRAAGLAGVVLGACLPDGRLDVPVLGRLTVAASGLDTTLHRAFDLVPDFDTALEQAIDLGFRRILTSGGKASALEGADRIGALVKRAAGRITIMPGAGVTAGNVSRLLALGATEVHGSCSAEVPQSGQFVELGFGLPMVQRTEVALVQALKSAVH